MAISFPRHARALLRPGEAARVAWVFAAVVYFVTLGGSSAGEQLTLLRAVNALLGAVLIGLMIARLRAQHDRLDGWIVLALLLFVAACLFSANLRQSLDAAVQVLAFGALFWWARGFLQSNRAYSALIWTFGGLAIALTAFFAVEWGGLWLEWLRLTDFAGLPPLSLPLPSGLYLHRHDVALLLVMLAPALLLPIGFGRLRAVRVVAVLAIGLVLLIDGSRTVMLAIGAAGVAAVVIAGRPRERVARLVRAIPRRALIGAAAFGALLVVVGLVVAAPVVSRLVDFQTVGARGELWSAAVDMWAQDPITGRGPGTYQFGLFDTGYFDTNSFFPRNPDGALLHIAAESGLLGMAALALIAIGVLRSRAASGRPLGILLFGPFAFVFAGIGSVPADFAYLVATGVLWLAAAYPRAEVIPEPQPTTRPLVVRRVSLVAAAPIALATCAILAAGFAYEGARGVLRRGETAEAVDGLTVAATLDPGFALYWRALGAAHLAAGGVEDALAALEVAEAREPMDPVAFRLEATAHLLAGDRANAMAAADRALELQASEPLNHLVAAAVKIDSDPERAAWHAEQAFLAQPHLVAVDWGTSLRGLKPAADDADRVLAQWASQSDRVILSFETVWLEALSGASSEHEVVEAVAAQVPRSREGMHLLFACEPELAAARLAEAQVAERANSGFWAVGIMIDRVLGRDADDKVALGQITGIGRGIASTLSSSPFAEMWAYRRLPLPAIEMAIQVPSSEDAADFWLADPRAAAEAAGVERLAECSPAASLAP